jgi:hypothetical protein
VSGGLFRNFSVNFRAYPKIFLGTPSGDGATTRSDPPTRPLAACVASQISPTKYTARKQHAFCDERRHLPKYVIHPVFIGLLEISTTGRSHHVSTFALGMHQKSRQITIRAACAVAFSAQTASRVTCIVNPCTGEVRYLHFVRVCVEIDVHGTPIPRKQGNSNDKSRPPRSSRGEDRCLVGGS